MSSTLWAERGAPRIKVTDSGCWLWTGPPNASGYGELRVNYKHWLAHRFAYVELVGPIPEGHDLDHLCRVRACCNPAHLEPVTRGENLARGEGIPATVRRLGRCVAGHQRTPENTYYRKDRPGHSHCRACARERDRRRRAA